MIMKMLSLSSSAKINLLAIQPKSLTLNGEVSREVKKSIDWLEKTITEAVKKADIRDKE